MSILFDRSTARTAFGILAVLGLVFSMFALTAPVLADHDPNALHLQQETPIVSGEYENQGDEEECDDLADGDSRWHFIATNAPAHDHAEVTAWFGDGSSQTLVGTPTGGAIHFTFDSDSDTLTDAYVLFYDSGSNPVAYNTSPPATRLVLSHVCAGEPEESPSPEESVEASPEESPSPEQSVEASPEESPEDKITICHAAGLAGTDKFVELELPWSAVYGPGGHFNEDGTPQAGHEDDILGECPTEESVEPSPEESPEESVEASPEESPEQSPEDSPRESELGGNPTPTPGGGTVPDTALGTEGVPAWPFAFLTLMSLGGLLYLRLTTEAERTR